MTLTDKIKTVDDKIKKNQAQYNLDREATTISALSSEELDKNDYLINKDLGYKPEVLEKVEFKYCPSDKVLNGKAESKTDKLDKTYKRDKNLIYNSQNYFVKFRDIGNFKKISFDSIHKRV